jgi:hypothetical protein
MEWTTVRTLLMFMRMLYLTGVMLRGQKEGGRLEGSKRDD